MSKRGRRVEKRGRARATARKAHPRGRRRWRGRRKALATLAPVLVIAGAAGLLFAAPSGGAKRPESPPPPTPTVPPATDTTATRGMHWLAGREKVLLARVSSDLGRLLKAEETGNHHELAAAGVSLEEAARAALASSAPPVDAPLFETAMRDLRRAGDATARKHAARDTRLLTMAELDLTAVTAALDAPATTKPTPQVPEPNN